MIDIGFLGQFEKNSIPALHCVLPNLSKQVLSILLLNLSKVSISCYYNLSMYITAPHRRTLLFVNDVTNGILCKQPLTNGVLDKYKLGLI